MRAPYKITERVTAARLEFLHSLAVKGPQERPSNVVGYQCHQLGWTEWNWVVKETDEQISYDAAREKWGLPELWHHVEARGTRITDKGRKILKENLK